MMRLWQLIAVSALFLGRGAPGWRPYKRSPPWKRPPWRRAGGRASPSTRTPRSDDLGLSRAGTQSLIGTQHLDHFLVRFRDDAGGSVNRGVRSSVGFALWRIPCPGRSNRLGLSQATVGGSAGSECEPRCSPSPPPGRRKRSPDVRWSSSADWTGQRSAHRRHEGQWGLTGLEASALGADTVRVWNGERAPGASPGWTCTSWPRRAANGRGRLRRRTRAPVDTGQPRPVAGHLDEGERRRVGFHDLGGNGAAPRPGCVIHTWWTNGPCPADLAILAWGINDAHMAPTGFNPDIGLPNAMANHPPPPGRPTPTSTSCWSPTTTATTGDGTTPMQRGSVRRWPNWSRNGTWPAGTCMAPSAGLIPWTVCSDRGVCRPRPPALQPHRVCAHRRGSYATLVRAALTSPGHTMMDCARLLLDHDATRPGPSSIRGSGCSSWWCWRGRTLEPRPAPDPSSCLAPARQPPVLLEDVGLVRAHPALLHGSATT